jgi:ATP-binding cassette subfamily B protein
VLRLLQVFARIDRRLTVGVIALGTFQGLLLPAFTIATGALAGAVDDGRSTTGPLVFVAVVFTVQRLTEPLMFEISATLTRKVDEVLLERVMHALASPPGLAHVEDPTVLDAALQAQGALTGVTPGEAATRLGFLIRSRIWGLVSLLMVASYKWWLVPILGLTYAIAYRFMRRHFAEVTVVMHGNTDRLRRAYYLRTLALTHTVAKETRVYGLAPWFVDRYRTSWLGVMQDVWAQRREAWAEIVAVAAALFLAEGVALGLVATDAAAGDLAVGAAVTLAQALVGAAVLAQFDWNHWAVSESVIALDMLEDLEQRAEDASHQLDGDRGADGLPAHTIRFEDVRFTYPGREETVFDGLDLEIEAGRSLAIVGENGAGKTTFVKLLSRLYDPDGGRILVDDVDLREIDPAAWRRRLAPVFQDFLQLEVSAFDNVAFGALDRRDDVEGVHEAGALAGATPLIARLPEQWDTVLSREFTAGTQLSGGEWQRLALARAMFAVQSGGASVLILDEPTAAMDVRGEAEVYDRFLELTRGVTTIVISHRFSTVRRADRIVVVEHGRIVEDGSHDSLMAEGGHYARMYSLQAARFTDA